MKKRIILDIILYAFILYITSIVFSNNFHVDKSLYGIWIIILSTVIYVLNKVLKPLIKWLTLPISALTFGMFNFIINLIILKIADFIMLGHFNISNILMSVLISVFITLLNVIVNKIKERVMI